ncbi:peptidylprolyl isomerase, partial [bacterium]
GGTVAADGTYTPPATAGTYHVRVELPSNPASRTEASITVTGAVSISINEAPRLTSPGSRVTFVAPVTGNPDSRVVWSASAGTIDENGKLTAPDTAGDVTVTATSVASPSKKATTVVKVIENPAIRFKFEGKSDLIVVLDTAKAPDTSANLVALVNEKFYDGIRVHRLEADFVVQWGDPLTKTLPIDDPSIGSGGPGYTIPFETNDLKNVAYSLAMARKTGKDTAGSQIYINLKDNETLDGEYVVFGTAITRTAVNNLSIGDRITTATVEERD